MDTKDVSQWTSFADRIKIDVTKRSFDDLGYVRLEAFLNSEEIDDILYHLQKYREEVVPTLKSQFVFYEDKSNTDTILRLERMLWHDPYFQSLADSQAFNGLAQLLLGKPCKTDNVQWFSKPPGAKATPPHQDGQYFMHGRGITFWLALDAVDESNGAMYYCPGTHKLGLLPHRRSNQIGFS